MRALLLTILLAAPASADIFSYGLIVGTPFTDVTQTTTIAGLNYLRNSTLLTIGPTVQVNLPAGFRFEIDALYRPIAYQIATSVVTTNISGSQWRFPVLLQYRLGKHPLVHPYVEGGLSFDTLTNLQRAAGLLSTQPGAVVKTTDAGLVLGFGADIKVPFIRISPEIRYTRQFSSEFQGISELNQAEFLVGLRF